MVDWLCHDSYTEANQHLMKPNFSLLKISILSFSMALLMTSCGRSGKEAAEAMTPEVRQSPVAPDVGFVQDPKCLKVSEFLSALTGEVKSEKTDKGFIVRQTITDAVTKGKTETGYVFERIPNQNGYIFTRLVVNGMDGNESDIGTLYAQMLVQLRGVPGESR